MSYAEIRNNNLLSRFKPIDIATLAYIVIEILIVASLMIGRPGWLYMLFFYFSAAAIVLIMVAFPFDESSVFQRTVRNAYPMILFLFLYKAVGPQIFLVFDQPFDPQVHGLELSMLGLDPAFYLQKYVEIWVNELMGFAYFSYYLLLPLAVATYVVLRKWDSLEKIMLSSALAFYICYLIFIFYPVIGPRFYLADTYYLPIIGPLFTPLTKNIVDFGGLYGAAMPSSHCAIALIVAWRISRDIGKLAIPAISISTLLCAATVYGRFHYLTDVVAGLIIGILGIWAADRWIGSTAGKPDLQQFTRPEEVEERVLAADLKDV